METLLVEAVVHQQPQGFGADALVPVGFGHPVTRFGIVLADADIALSVCIIAYAANGLTRLLEFDGPDVVAVEDRPDDFQTLLHALVRRPARAGPHLRIGGVFEKCFGVALAPRPQQDSCSLHHVFYKLLIQT